MSDSPAKEPDVVEQPSPDADATMEDPHSGTYEFEVKEQDRWLPIANG